MQVQYYTINYFRFFVEQGPGYDGYEDPEVDEFDSVRLVYREDDGNF